MKEYEKELVERKNKREEWWKKAKRYFLIPFLLFPLFFFLFHQSNIDQDFSSIGISESRFWGVFFQIFIFYSIIVALIEVGIWISIDLKYPDRYKFRDYRKEEN